MAEGTTVGVKKVGVLCNPHYPETLDLATKIQETLQERGTQVLCGGADIKEEPPSFPPDLDVLVTLGGDGTMLRAAHLVSDVATPILGIHMGRLGFLAEVRVENWRESLDRVFDNDYWVEERAMLRGELERDGAELGSWEALNEIVIGRSGISHMVRLATFVDGGYFTTYVADGLIVATATGSTAYALSAGGPILPPNLRNMLLVPICPHLSLDRTIVLADGATVMVQVESTREGVLIVDGMSNVNLQDQDRIVLTTSPHVARFLRLYDRRQVYETLLERLKPRKIERPYGAS
ncbi:MAG: NAD(+)/NADH kinase [Anaerolineae bacterium]|nr:NAD(+)/NADH kinase [Anaerolineae bacterium]